MGPESVDARKNAEMENVDHYSSRKTKPIPIILITDIGAHIDGTLALFVLLGAIDVVKIIACVTTVNNGLHRGALLRGYLRLLDIKDIDVEILPTYDGLYSGCFVPEGFPNVKEANIKDFDSTPTRIVELCEEHKETGVIIFSLGTLTPLAKAIEIDIKSKNCLKTTIKRLYFQGSCNFSNGEEISNDPLRFQTQPTRLLPNKTSNNFKNDFVSANTVFQYFQDFIPFTLLGESAAEKITVCKGDLKNWTKVIRESWKETFIKYQEDLKVTVPNPPDLLFNTKQQMKSFRERKVNEFNTKFTVPNENLTEYDLEELTWFDSVSNDYICSNPYGSLLALRLVEDLRKDFSYEKHSVSGASTLFQDYTALNENGHEHTILGNIPSRHSNVDSELILATLQNEIVKGMQLQRNEDVHMKE